ncbi:hypothetical protein [Fodinicurvata sp. EGI_FJ10296]|uniref:hypothetical protein n=1 Tax=Fodinicurvata sp. EGI_FJ10296 TaxID=3231908 RepID=UPI003453F593
MNEMPANLNGMLLQRSLRDSVRRLFMSKKKKSEEADYENRIKGIMYKIIHEGGQIIANNELMSIPHIDKVNDDDYNLVCNLFLIGVFEEIGYRYENEFARDPGGRHHLSPEQRSYIHFIHYSYVTKRDSFENSRKIASELREMRNDDLGYAIINSGSKAVREKSDMELTRVLSILQASRAS